MDGSRQRRYTAIHNASTCIAYPSFSPDPPLTRSLLHHLFPPLPGSPTPRTRRACSSTSRTSSWPSTPAASATRSCGCVCFFFLFGRAYFGAQPRRGRVNQLTLTHPRAFRSHTPTPLLLRPNQPPITIIHHPQSQPTVHHPRRPADARAGFNRLQPNGRQHRPHPRPAHPPPGPQRAALHPFLRCSHQQSLGLLLRLLLDVNDGPLHPGPNTALTPPGRRHHHRHQHTYQHRLPPAQEEPREAPPAYTSPIAATSATTAARTHTKLAAAVPLPGGGPIGRCRPTRRGTERCRHGAGYFCVVEETGGEGGGGRGRKGCCAVVAAAGPGCPGDGRGGEDPAVPGGGRQ